MLTLFSPRPKKDIERKFDTFSQQLAQAFAQIKTDISELNSKVESQQADMDRINQWVSYLHRYGQRLSDSHSNLSQKYEKITENHQKLHSSHQEHTARQARSVEELQNRHRELQEQLAAHKAELKNTFQTHLESNRELSRHEIESLKGWVSHIYTGIDSERQKADTLRKDIEVAQQAWNRSYSALKAIVDGLRQENETLKQDMSKVGSSVEKAHSEVAEAKNLVKSHISELKSEALRTIQPVQPIQVVQPAPQVSIQPTVFPSSGFERHIISRVLPNRKSYVLKFIVDLASENRFSTKEIESIVVDEKRLCGRTSFYAYLKELRYRGQISTANIDERVIVVGTASKPQKEQKTFDEIVDNLDKGQ